MGLGLAQVFLLGHPGGSWYTANRDHALALALAQTISKHHKCVCSLTVLYGKLIQDCWPDLWDLGNLLDGILGGVLED